MIFQLSNAAEIMLLFPFGVFIVFDNGRKRQHESNAKKRVLQTGFETLSSHLTRLCTQGLAL
jgi:hypothetical protein